MLFTALTTAVFIIILIPYGPGVTFDSISFFQVGENFWSDFNYEHLGADGNNVFAAHRFPLYPLILGVFSRLPFGIIVLQILLFAAFSFLFFRFFERLKISLFFGFVILSFPIIVSFYAVWTESLFMVLSLSIFLKIWDYQFAESKKTMRIILLLIFLLCLTRLVGLALAGSVFLFFLVQKKWKNAFYSILAGLVPFICWTLLGIYHIGETARNFTFHAQKEIGFKLVYGLGECFIPANFVDGTNVQTLIGSVVLTLPIFLFLVFRKAQHFKFLLLMVVHFYVYLILLIFCILFIDVSIPIETRTLLPAIFTFILLFILCVHSASTTRKNQFILIPLFIFGLSVNPLYNLMQYGLGYSSNEWNEFKFVEQLKTLSAETIYTNDQHAVWYFSGKKSIQLPQKSDLYTQKINPTYIIDINQMSNQILPGEEIVWIRSGATSAIYPTYEEIKLMDGLEIIYDDWLCVILTKKKIICAGFEDNKNLDQYLR